MASLSQNIGQAIADFDSIKTAIEDKGVTVGIVPTSEYADKISEIKTGQELFFTATGKCYPAELVFPDNVTSIPNNAFESCVGIEKVFISNTVSSIGTNAFRGCRGLTSITISHGVTSIGTQAFYECTSLTSISIPNTVTRWGANVLLACSNLENATLEEGFNCTGLNLNPTKKLTVNSMVNMFNALADLTGQEAKTITLGNINLAKLTAEQKQIATNKNWNLA